MVPVELCGFVDQRRSAHALVAITGCGVFVLAYVIVLASFGVQSSESATANDHRRAIAIAGIACWIYFAMATIVARGGPVLNTVFYPVAIVTGVPAVVSWYLGGSNGAIFTMGAPFTVSWAIDLLVTVIPGISIGAVILFGWGFIWMDGNDRLRWCKRNLPAAFRSMIFAGHMDPVEPENR